MKGGQILMKIAIINISLRPGAKVKYVPIGLGYVMTSIKNAGYEFDYIDQDLYNMQEAEVLEKISDKYDVVLMGCIVTGYKYVKSLVGKIKKQSPNTIIGVGNSVATSIPEELLKFTETDVAFLGEGDETDVEFLQILEKGGNWSEVKGIAYKDSQGKIVYTNKREPISDISKLYIDYSMFEIDKYIPYMGAGIARPLPMPEKDLKAFPVNTARGCINKCTFCYHVFRNNIYRRRTIKAIMDDVEYLINNYGVNYVTFADDLSFYNKKIIEEFLYEKEKRGLTFFWDGTCRGNLFNSEEDIILINRMKSSGCHNLGFSLESSNPDILKAMNKNIKVEDFIMQARLLKQGGVAIGTSIVIGYPQETPETIKNTFDICIECEIVPSVGYLLPQPGSEIYDYAITHGYIKDVESYLLALGDRQDLRINMTKIPDNELEKIVEENIIRTNNALGVISATDNLLKTQNYFVGGKKKVKN